MGSFSLLTSGNNVDGPARIVSRDQRCVGAGARIAAQIAARHPDYWPEAVRAMVVHSAQWTPAMLPELNATQSKRARYVMVRRFGYGVPNLERALASAGNDVALFAQAVIQPFASGGGRRFNKCHYYTLPIPPVMLEALDNEPVELKVTLSYFIEPNPGLSANVDPQRYQSHGLRFDHQRRRETVTRFKQRVNPAERDGRRPAGEGADPNWMLGEDSISAGSLHCDVWTGPAIDLLDRDTLCVKPVNGWWRYRASLDICNGKSRYALIVTLRALNPDVEIYTRRSVRVSACQRRCRLRLRSDAHTSIGGRWGRVERSLSGEGGRTRKTSISCAPPQPGGGGAQAASKILGAARGDEHGAALARPGQGAASARTVGSGVRVSSSGFDTVDLKERRHCSKSWRRELVYWCWDRPFE